jgi:AraC-like DNA-binding protein
LSLAQQALRQHRYQELIHKHLSRLLKRLFAEFTGLHFHISWAPAPPHRWDAAMLPTACSVCCRLSGNPLLATCRTCGPRQLQHALRPERNGHHFTCRLGVRNCWIPIRVRSELLGIAYLQALDGAAGAHPRRRAGRARLPASTRAEFVRATRLLRHLVQHAQTAALADLRKADLTNAGHAVLALEKEQARLHETLQRHLPSTPQQPRRAGAESHPEQLVHHLLERIDRQYGQPITLRGFAVQLGMNPTYLSDLFSRVLGVPFKTYLTRLRIEKAKGLLGDPTKSVSQVAEAVGYAGENRFRIAFKSATGLSPRVWRATMQPAPEARS